MTLITCNHLTYLFGEYNRKKYLTVEIIRIVILRLGQDRDKALGPVSVSPWLKTSLFPTTSIRCPTLPVLRFDGQTIPLFCIYPPKYSPSGGSPSLGDHRTAAGGESRRFESRSRDEDYPELTSLLQILTPRQREVKPKEI
ncbi:hypothetical protein TNCV_3171151 [Trichonephila clavipes]|nr:hypothetical protein TNCV_3171151 [Trichonephila clavipes]